jgi:hypothetical protein
MSEKTLRELIEQAEADLDRFKHPNVGEVQERLHEILMAGKVGGIAHDKLESLYFSRGELHIGTSYSVRSCSMRGEYDIPEAIIDAADPISEIKGWSAKKKVRKAEAEYKSALESVERRKKDLDEAKAALAAVRKDNKLLADANSHYSAAQLEEIEHQAATASPTGEAE